MLLIFIHLDRAYSGDHFGIRCCLYIGSIFEEIAIISSGS